MRYIDLKNNTNEKRLHTGNGYNYDGPITLWRENGGTSMVEFHFHSDGGTHDRGVHLKLSCKYP